MVERRDPAAPRPAPSRSDEISSQPLQTASAPPPAATQPQARPERPPRTHEVARGDTLFSLSERYGVPLAALIEMNGLEPPYTLRVGQTLRLPQPETHVVRSGETISLIAARYNIDPPSLLLLNRLSDPRALKAGEVLTLPPANQPRQTAAASPSRSPATTPSSTRSEPTRTTSNTAVETTTSSERSVSIRSARFDWPIEGRILSRFGPKTQGLRNDGVNIAASEGDPVKAAASGRVVYAGNELAGYGELVLVEHEGGWITAYAHNSRLEVAEGQSVSRGQVIARAGATGSVDSPQVHFEVRRGVDPVDPMDYLPGA